MRCIPPLTLGRSVGGKPYGWVSGLGEVAALKLPLPLHQSLINSIVHRGRQPLNQLGPTPPSVGSIPYASPFRGQPSHQLSRTYVSKGRLWHFEVVLLQFHHLDHVEVVEADGKGQATQKPGERGKMWFKDMQTKCKGSSTGIDRLSLRPRFKLPT